MPGITSIQLLQDEQELAIVASPGNTGEVSGAKVTEVVESTREMELWIDVQAIEAGVTAEFILETRIEKKGWAEVVSVTILTAQVPTPPKAFSVGSARANGDALGAEARVRFIIAGGTITASVRLLKRE